MTAEVRSQLTSLPASSDEPARRRSVRSLAQHPAIRAAAARRRQLARLRADIPPSDPSTLSHQGVNGATIAVHGEQFINYAGHDYLGLAGDPRVKAGAAVALDAHGTSCSAGRDASGPVWLHRELEQRIAAAYGVEDAVVTGSGYLTNAAVISFVLGESDLAVCDAQVHSSIRAGIRWGHCEQASFRHNDAGHLDEVLRRVRGRFGCAMVIVEGVYSVDGDIVALPEIVEVAKRHDCLVMVDEAHSFGVLGASGFGVAQHFGMDARDVDVWMGTLSTALSSYGGYLGGTADFCAALRTLAPGIGTDATAPAPSAMGAAIAAFDVMVAEPARAARLRANGATLARALRANGVATRPATGTPVVPGIVGATKATVGAAQALLEAGVHANPLVPPDVPQGQGRIRFFVSAQHTTEQLELTAASLGAHLRRPGRV